jgi:putative intracellular protease/amidase
MMEKKVLIVIPHNNFDDEEYKTVKEVLHSHGHTVETASTHLSEAQGKYSMSLTPDCLIGYVESGDYDAFVFIGEEAASEYYSNPDVLRIINQAHLTGKLLAAIGKAVTILAYSGKLTNQLVASDESEKSRLEELGAFFSPNPICETDDFITAAPGEAQELGERVVSALDLGKSGYLR